MTGYSRTFVRNAVTLLTFLKASPGSSLLFSGKSITIPLAERFQTNPEVSSELVQDQSDEFAYENGDGDYSATENDQVEYKGYPSYHTLNPTFDLLVDWTLDYADAVDLAGGMTRVSVGVQSMISEDFVFVSPEIGPVSKDDYISLMNYYQYNGLDLGSAIPDLTVSYEGWHQDPHDPWRIWVVARYSGTHTGTARLPGSGLMLSPSKELSEQKRFTTGPELQSFKWTPSKKLVFQTVGYIGDEVTGSGQGYGSIQGLLVSMGLPPLYLETTESIRSVQAWFSQFKTFGDAPRMISPYSYLPQWWHERKEFGYNIQR
jgi:hypothetical protein